MTACETQPVTTTLRPLTAADVDSLHQDGFGDVLGLDPFHHEHDSTPRRAPGPNGWVPSWGRVVSGRTMRSDWARSIRDQCQAAGIAFHFKQWGAYGPDGKPRPKHDNGRELGGRTWDEYPA